MTSPSHGIDRPLSARALWPLQSLADAAAPGQRFLAFFTLAVDHVFGRSPKKVGVGELDLDPADVALDLGEFLFEASGFGGKINHALEGQRNDVAAHHELNGTDGCGGGKGNDRNPGKPTNDILPSPCPLPRCCRRVGENERNLGAWRHIDFYAYRANLADEINNPADFGLGL